MALPFICYFISTYLSIIIEFTGSPCLPLPRSLPLYGRKAPRGPMAFKMFEQAWRRFLKFWTVLSASCTLATNSGILLDDGHPAPCSDHLLRRFVISAARNQIHVVTEHCAVYRLRPRPAFVPRSCKESSLFRKITYFRPLRSGHPALSSVPLVFNLDLNTPLEARIAFSNVWTHRYTQLGCVRNHRQCSPYLKLV